jgi:hypothetical protein
MIKPNKYQKNIGFNVSYSLFSGERPTRKELEDLIEKIRVNL